MTASAFNLGIVAAKRDKPLGDNPYPKGSDKAKWWIDGYKAADNEDYTDKHGSLIKDRVVYEKVSK